MQETKDLVKVVKGTLFCDSRIIAEKFGKQHKNILRDIEKLLKGLDEISGSTLSHLNRAKRYQVTKIFKERAQKYRGREFKYYELNRPAFSLLCMRFSGKKALIWQDHFNDAFYLMEEQLLRKSNLEWKESREQGKEIRIALTDEIKTFIDYATAHGSKNAGMYYVNISKMTYKALDFIEKNEKIDKTFRNTLDKLRLSDLVAAEKVARKAIVEGMGRELPYRDIFQLAKIRVLALADIMLIDKTK